MTQNSEYCVPVKLEAKKERDRVFPGLRHLALPGASSLQKVQTIVKISLRKFFKMKNFILASAIFYSVLQWGHSKPQYINVMSDITTESPNYQSWLWGKDLREKLEKYQKQQEILRKNQLDFENGWRNQIEEQNKRSYGSYGKVFFKFIWIVFVIIPLTCFCLCKKRSKITEEREGAGVQRVVTTNPINPVENTSNVFFIIPSDTQQNTTQENNTGNVEQPPSYEESVTSSNLDEPPSYEEIQRTKPT